MSALHAFLSRSFWRRCLTWCGAIFAFVVLGLASNVSTASAANGINRQINYQAKLSDALGFPVADGTYSFKFSLYDAASGGNVLWTASGTTATPLPLTVNISNGLFTVMLGDTSSTAGSQNPLNDAVTWNSDNLYLGVTVGADSEMSPRKRLAAAPYAFNAERLQGMSASGTAFGANNLFSINQTSNTSATGTRTALEVRSAGTSDANDFLIRGVNDLGSDVLSVNRQGNVTSTGFLTVTGSGTSTFSGAVSSTSGVFDRYLTVRGQSVCLADGTNCASASSADTFASVTARGAVATTTLSIFGGASVSFLNVTSTFGVSSTASFGGDVLLGNAPTDLITPTGRFNADILPSSDQGYALGSTTSRWDAYFASATATNQFTSIIASNSTFTSVSSVVLESLANVRQGRVVGNVLYVIAGGGVSALYAFDISQPEQPRRLGSLSVGSELTYFDVQGRYAYIVTTGASLHIVDLKNPANMSLIATTSIFGFGNGIHVSGKYAYIIDDIRFRVYDVSDPTNPYQVSQSGLYTNLNSLDVRGKYAYVFESSGSRNFRIFDVSNPNVVAEVGSVPLGGTHAGMGIMARDGYAFLSTNSSHLFTINITDPTAPYVQTTSTGVFANDGTSRGFASIGDYLIGKSALLSMRVMDVSDPTAPTSVRTFATTAFNPRSPIVAGNYLYVFDGSSVSANFNVIRLPGMRAATLEAGSVLTEGLQVIDSARFGNNVDILSGLSVYDGIRSFGALSVYAPSVTSTFFGDVSVFGTVSTTNLFVSDQRVCLENGSNCPTSGGSDSNWAYNASGNFIRMVTSTNDIVFGNTVTSTGAGAYFDLSGGANGTSTIYFGFATNTNVVLGGTSTTQTGLNGLFAMNGNDLFVNGNVGSASSVYTNGAFYAGTTTWFGDGVVTSTGALTIGGSFLTVNSGAVFTGYTSFASRINSDLIPQADATRRLGVSGSTWNAFFTDATTTNLYATGFVSTTQLTVGGNTVCLTNGTNCPSSSGGTDSNWAYNAAGNFLRMVTSTNDLVLGNTATSSGAGVYFDLSGGQNGTSTVYLGFATNTNVVLGGTSTTQTGLHPNFVMDGNDLFVNGSVGSASSVYTNGAFVAGTGTTRLSDGLIAKTNGVLTITTASGTRVQNSIDNTLDAAHVMSLVTSTHLTQNAIQNVLIRGRYAYVYHDTGRFTIMDMSDPSNPTELSTTFIGAAAAYNSFDVSGNYLYYYDYTRLQIFDLSNPRNPRLVGAVSGLTSNGEIKVAGSYAYIVSVGNYFVINVADPANPFVAGALGSGVGAGEQSVQNGYAYVAGDFGNTFNVVDVRNPAKPTMAYSSTTIAQTPNSLVTQGRYAYMAYHDNGAIDIIDIASSTSPVTVKRFATGEANFGSKNVLSIQGRYLYVLGDFDFRVFDVSSSTNPVLVNTSANFGVNAFANGIAVSGRYAYIGLTSPTNILVYDVLGTETNGLQAGSAEFGTMTVRNDAVIAGRADLLGGLSVGLSGIRSDGALSVNAYGATSTFKGDVMVQGTVSTTALYVNSQSVCLVNGTNCPISGSSGTSTVDLNWRYTATGNFVRQATTTSDLLIGGANTSTGGAVLFDVSADGSSNSNVYFGYKAQTNVLIGGTSTTEFGLNSAFTVDGNDLFVNGNIGSVSSVYTNGAFVAGQGSTYFGDGFINKTNGNLSVAASGGFLLPTSDLGLTLGSTSLRFNGVFGSVSSTNVSSTNVTVGRSIDNRVASGTTLTLVGQKTLPSGPMAVLVSGKYAYVGHNVFPYYLDVIDVTNPAATVVATSVVMGGTVESLAKAGNYLVVTERLSNKIEIMDVSNPASSTVISSMSITAPKRVAVNGRYVYVASSDGLVVLDIVNPYSPVILSTVASFTSAYGVATNGRYAYVTDLSTDLLSVVDVSNPTAPRIVGTTSTDNGSGAAAQPREVSVQNGYAYVVNTNDTNTTFAVINISDAARPVYVTALASAFNGNDTNALFVNGRYAYVLEADSKIHMIDIGKPTAPFEVAATPSLSSTPYGIAVSGRYAYTLIQSFDRMDIFDVGGIETNGLAAQSAEIGQLQVLSDASVANRLSVGNALSVGRQGIFSEGALAINATGTTSTFAGALTVQGQYVCLANGTNCQTNLLITSSTNFTTLENNNAGGISGFTDIAIAGRHAYTVRPGAMDVYSFQNPNDLQLVGSYSTLFGPQAIKIQGRYAYIANFSSQTMVILDISNPLSPSFVSETPVFGTGLSDLVVQGKYAYVSAGGTLNGIIRIYDISEPTNPKFISETSEDTPRDLYINGRYLTYLTDSAPDVAKVLDVSDPFHPTNAFTSGSLASAGDLSGQDDLIFTNDSGNFQVYDQSLTLLGQVNIGANAESIVPAGRYVYVKGNGGALAVINVSDTLAPTIAKTYSDPAWSAQSAMDVSGRYIITATDSGSRALSIVDTAGFEVGSLNAGSAEFGTAQVLGDILVNGQLKARKGLAVGQGGILSEGALGVTAPNATSTILGNLAIGTSTRDTALNALFTMNGGSLLVSGNIGSVSSVYTNGEFVAGSGSLHMGDGYISQNTGNLTLNSAGGYILPASDMALTFGSSTLRFNGEFGNVSSTNFFSNGRSKFAINTASPVVQSSVTALNAGGGFNDLFVSNHFLIVTDYTANEYRIFDATKPTAPELVFTSSTPSGTSGPWRPYIAGSYVYMPMFDSDSVAIINVFGQGQVGTMTGLNNVDHVQVNGQFAYVAYDSNVAIFDVHNPTDPVRISTVATDGGRNQGMDVYGKLILVANGGGSNRLQAINANNPYSAFLESSLLLDGNLSSVNVLNDTYAVVTDYSGHVYMVNKTAPNAMFNVSTSTIGSVINRAELEGNYLYATNEGAGEVYVVDVSDPYNVQLVKTITGVPNAFSIKVKGKTAYTVPIGTDHNLRIFDLGGLEASNFVAHSAELGTMSVLMDGTIGGNLYVNGGATVGANGLMSQGTLASATSVYANGAFVAGGHSTYYADGYIRKNNGPLTMSSVSGTMFLTTKPYIESQTLASGSNPRVMRTQGHYLYVTEFTAGKVAVYDVQDPKEPVFLDDVAVGSAPQSLVVDGNHLYVGTGNQIYSIDISNPYSLATDGSPLSTGNIDSMVKVGPYLYTIDSTADAIMTVDVSNPASMKKVNYTSTGGTNPLAIDTDGKALYVIDDASDNLKVFSAQFNPSLISTVALTSKNPQAVAVNGLYAYVLTNDVGGGHLRVVDISAGSEVSNVALGTSLFTNSIQVRGNYVYLATDNNTLEVYDVTDAYVPTRVQQSDAALNQSNGIWVDGRFAYFTNDNDDMIVVMNLGGADASAFQAGSVKTGQLDVDQNAQVGQNLMVNGGISAGGGFQVTGPSSISGQTSSATLKVINTGGNAGGAAWGAYINRLLVADATDAGLSSTGTANYQTLIKYTGTGGFAGLCLDDSTNGLSCPQVTGGASLLADNAITANAFDLAEQYTLNGSATATDLLIQVTTSTNTVKQSEAVPYDSRILGVYSTRPGFLLGWNQGVPVALTGRVPLKVSAVNGAITAGDPLTSSGIAGYAMKATHPGMIVGYALDSTTTTSTIDVFVKVGYDAKMALGTDAAGTITAVTDDLVFTATSTATALAPTSDSFGLTFRGSAWNGSAAVSEGYRMFTDILSATSSQFTIQNNSSTNIFTINKSGSAQLTGDLQIGGKLYPSGRGTIQHDKYIYLDDSAAPTSTYMATNADGWQSNSSYDFAERYYSPDALEPGDLVVVSRTGELHVQRSLDATTMLAGIVSTKPGFVTGAPATSTFPIALSGRVPTKVSTVKGNIVTGDPLAPSTIPGVAVKATEAGPIVGYALQDYDQTGVGKIEVFVNPVWWGGDLAKLVQDAANAAANTSNVNTGATNGKTAQGLAVMKAGAKQLHIAYASIKAYPNVQVTPRGEVVGTWWTDGYSDTGFDIYLKQAQDRDVTFTWRVEATAEGEDLFYSDGTASKVDSLLGAPLVGTQTVVTPTVTSTTPAPAPETTTTTEEAPPAPTVEPMPEVTPDPVLTTTEPAADPATTTTP